MSKINEELKANLSKKDKRYLRKQNKLQRKDERKKAENNMKNEIEDIDKAVVKSNINLLLLLIRPILFIYMGIVLMVIAGQTDIETLAPFWAYSVFIVNLITIIILMVVLYVQKIGIRALFNYKEKSLEWWKHLLLILGVILLSLISGLIAEKLVYGTAGVVNGMLIKSVSVMGTFAMALLIPVTTVFAEDFFFFAYISNAVENTKANMFLIAIMIIAQHMFFPFALDISFMIYRFLSLMPIFIAYLVMYRKTKNMIPVVISHILINWVTIMLMLV